MATWWLALGPVGEGWTSYAEIEHRKVIPQGFPRVGNLISLLPHVMGGREVEFKHEIRRLHWIAYGHDKPQAGIFNLWNLLRIRRGDLIVAREGAQARGICQASQNGWQSYRYDPTYNYAQTVSYPVNWVDWNELWNEGRDPPNTPAMVSGIIPVGQETHERIVAAWVNYIRRQAENDPLDADDPVP